MTTNNTFNFSTLSINQKRDLVKQLRDEIKSQVLIQKQNRFLIKANKESAKKAKLENAIKAAQEKLAKLQAKLA